MKNLIKKIERKLLIDELDYSNFLVAFKSYLHKGTDIHTSLERFVITSDSCDALKNLINEMKKTIEKRGADVFPDLLLKNGFLKNTYEITLYRNTKNKAEAIDLILANRKKADNISKKYLEVYFIYALAFFALMSLYVFEDLIIKSFIETSHLFTSSKTASIYIKPKFWKPLELFIVALPFFIYYCYLMIVVLFVKRFSLKLYYKVQKHQETNDVIDFVRMLKEQVETGITLYEAIENVKGNVDRSMKPALNSVLKKLKQGKNSISKVFLDHGYSKQVSSVLQELEHQGNYSEILENCLVELNSRREELRFKIFNKTYNDAKFKLYVFYLLISFFITIETYRAFIGVNIR